jgi:NAD(P)H-flavin reductase/hemoglobin-like flavoprotein
LDAQRLRDSFAYIASLGDEVTLFFYSDLFLRNPGLRDLFPMSMSVQRERLLQAFGKIAAEIDSPDILTPYLQGLGRDHRKFGVNADDYAALGASLLCTLAYFCGSGWTAELAADWRDAYGLAAQVMIEAARQDEDVHPAWWDATVIGVERRSFDITVFRVATDPAMSYLPGQSVTVESEMQPRIWRFYSIANAPRDDATMDFHVRTEDGGALSPILARGLQVGSRLRLGAPVGTLTLDTSSGRDILMIAGGTGLAPLKAIIEQVATLPRPPHVSLFFGARSAEDLYDLPYLEKLAARHSWLSVTSSTSDDPAYGGERGTAAEIAARHGTWLDHDAYVCGSTAMVEATISALTSLGIPPSQIHVEEFGWSQS